MASSQVPALDQSIDLERRVLDGLFRVSPEFSFHDDRGGLEAFALPGTNSTHIYLGIGLVQDEIRRNRTFWQTAVIGILAHEWAHAFQYQSGLQEKQYMWETHADYLAGWYLGSKYASGVLSLNPSAFARSLYLKGDNEGYFDPDRYGSPEMRVDALLAGFDMGEHDFRPHRKPDVWEAANRGYAYVAASVR